ncbi:MAG: hypothetical protein J6R47_05755 [Acholeplasmatales bacterium]|nr:hypothetical protein [Acholeplasmatales bacterium]
MSRYTPEFNAYARRVVKSFNQRVMRAEKRGLKNLPSLRSVRDLKAMFTTEDDLKKELSELRKFNENRKALDTKLLGNEAKLTNWEYEYIRNNLDELKDYYDREIERARKRYAADPFSPELKVDLTNLEDRRDYLNRDLLELSKSELSTFRRYLNVYKNRNRRDLNFYDQYFESFDFLMRVSGVSKDKINYIRTRINSLTPNQFYELYKQHDIMADLFNEIPSKDRGEYYAKLREIEQEKKAQAESLGVDTKVVNEKVDTLIENLDVWIDKAIENAG